MVKTNNSFTPVYRTLFERYREDILAFRLKPGDQIDSIAVLQKRYRVGRETAKRVLGLLEQEGLIVQHRGKGSFVRDLGPRRKVWGLVFPFHSMQYEELILAISERAAAQGREFQHFCTYNDFEEEIRLVAQLLKERCEAVMVIPTLDESRTWRSFYSRIPSWESPIVLLDHTMTSNDFPFVIQSYDLGVTRALLYMMEQKAGGIAFVENKLWAGRNMVRELMRGTYLESMRSRRPDFEPLILPSASAVNADILRECQVTGVLCCDDVSGIHVIGRLHEQGMKVPEEVNVVGYGNTHLSRYFTPPMTSIDPCNEEMADVLRAFLDPARPSGKMIQKQHVVQPRIVIRGT
jgi:DNA-binding LacI/PurR family transcriptional regulator